MRIEDLKVRRGDPIQPFVQRLLKELPRMFRFFPGQGVRLNRTPDGIIVVADLRTNPWDHPFRVAFGALTATITNGTVNNMEPRIDGATIDGLDDQGNVVTPPTLDLSEGPGEDLRSWVCIQAIVGSDGQIDPKDKTALTIVHATRLDPKTTQGGSPNNGQGAGLQPIAMLQWDDGGDGVEKIYQIVYHNLQHRFVSGGTGQGTTGRHFFWAL